MGSRANFIFVDEAASAGYELFYNHWAGNSLDCSLFWGPEHAAESIRSQKPVDPAEGWLDTDWAEGGALFDPAAKTFVLFGGEDIDYDLPLRRAYMKLLAIPWAGWTVRWAEEGLVTLAEYVGVARERVRGRYREDTTKLPSIAPHPERDYVETVLTLRTAEGLQILPLCCGPTRYLASGPRLLKAVLAEGHRPERETFDRREWLARKTASFPEGGLHLDPAAKTLDFWCGRAEADLLATTTAAWPGLRVTDHVSEYEAHERLAGPALRLCPPDERGLFEHLLKVLDREIKPVDVEGIAAAIAEQTGKSVEVNPEATEDRRRNMEAARRREILERCREAVGLA